MTCAAVLQEGGLSDADADRLLEYFAAAVPAGLQPQDIDFLKAVPLYPTIAAAGVPGYEAASTACIWVPAGTPGTVIARLNREIVRILSEANVKDKLLGSGIEAIGSSPKQAYDYVQSDMAKWAKLIKEAHLDTD